MTLRGDIIAMIAPGGVKVSRVYWQFRDLDRSRIDAALLGLYADGVLVRVGDVVARPAHTPQIFLLARSSVNLVILLSFEVTGLMTGGRSNFGFIRRYHPEVRGRCSSRP